jgi:hypothetical protein
LRHRQTKEEGKKKKSAPDSVGAVEWRVQNLVETQTNKRRREKEKISS